MGIHYRSFVRSALSNPPRLSIDANDEMDYVTMAGRRLASARKAAGFDLEELCAGIHGLDPERLREFESGRAYPPPHVLRRLASRLRDSPDFLGALDFKLHRFAVTPGCGQQEYALQRIGQHVHGRMEECGLDAAALASRTGMREDRLRRILQGKEDGSASLLKLAETLNCSVNELLCGCFKDTQSDFSRIGGPVPLVSWPEAAEGGIKAHPPLERRVCCPLHHGGACFALRLTDGAMEGKGRKAGTWRTGDIIFVDPDRAAEAGEGSLVLARLEESGDAVFRLLSRAGDGLKLTALNSRIPRPRGAFRIIGLVIGSWHMKGDDF